MPLLVWCINIMNSIINKGEKLSPSDRETESETETERQRHREREIIIRKKEAFDEKGPLSQHQTNIGNIRTKTLRKPLVTAWSAHGLF